MHNQYTSSDDRSCRGGLLATLLAFALTWFLVNGTELPQDNVGVLSSGDPALCVARSDKSTSRFLNAPLPAPVPWYGG